MIFTAQVAQLEEYKTLLQLLNPFAPHITEELWEVLGFDGEIAGAKWPEFLERQNR